MTATLLLGALLLLQAKGTETQVDSTAPRSTTERPNMSAPGLQQTLTGVLMDAGCSAITDSRSELTKTPRLVPRTDTRNSPDSVAQTRSSEQARSQAAAESAIPDTYRDCKVKPASTSFAIYASGKMFMFDRVSNQMMQEHLANAGTEKPNGSGWSTKTVVGTATSDNVLTLRSVRK